MDNPVYIVVTPFFPTPTSWRGSFCYDFVAWLKKVSRYRVEVFMEGDGDDFLLDGIHVHLFKSIRLPSDIFPFLFSRRNNESFLRAIQAADIRISDVAFCHAHTAKYGNYAIALRALNPSCKAILHHHDLQSYGLNGGLFHSNWLYNMVEYPILQRMHEQIDLHVFISDASRKSFLSAPDTSWTIYEDYKKQMRGLPYRPVSIKESIVLHNGVDRNVFKYNEATKVSNRRYTIGCVSNFQVLKDQMTLLRAIKGLPVKVKFVGSGETLASCVRYSRRHGLDVEFLPEMRHEALVDFYHSIDLFVLPSYFEGFGCVYIEAWASGVPFIACRRQGIEELINEDDRDRCLIHPFDDVALRKLIKDFMRIASISEARQKLTGPIYLDELIPDFVNRIECLK